jgi:hypothetical protein
MIARLFGVPVGDRSERGESAEDSGDETIGIGRLAVDPLSESKEPTKVKGSMRVSSLTIGLVVIGMMMVAVGALLLFPISLSLEHARIIGGLGFFVVGVSVIFNAATSALSSRERIE